MCNIRCFDIIDPPPLLPPPPPKKKKKKIREKKKYIYNYLASISTYCNIALYFSGLFWVNIKNMDKDIAARRLCNNIT